MISVVVTNRYMQRDMRLFAEADRVIAANTVDGSPEANETHIGLSVQLELQTILCTEYRYVHDHIVILELTLAIEGIHISPL